MEKSGHGGDRALVRKRKDSLHEIVIFGSLLVLPFLSLWLCLCLKTAACSSVAADGHRPTLSTLINASCSRSRAALVLMPAAPASPTSTHAVATKPAQPAGGAGTSSPASSSVRASSTPGGTVRGKAGGGGVNTVSSPSSTSVSTTSHAASKTSKAPAKAKSSTTVRVGSSSTVIPLTPQQLDKPSKGIPKGAIAAIIVVVGVIVAAAAYRLWLYRARRRERSAAAPLPPVRQAFAGLSVYSKQGGGGQASAAAAPPPSQTGGEEDYWPLEPPHLRNQTRTNSWISFDGKSPATPSSASADASPIATMFASRASIASPAQDPFASDVEVTRHRAVGGGEGNSQFGSPHHTGTHGDNTHFDSADDVIVNHMHMHGDGDVPDSPDNVAALLRYSFGEDPSRPLPDYPTLSEESDSQGSSRQPRSPLPPQAMLPSSSISSHSSHSLQQGSGNANAARNSYIQPPYRAPSVPLLPNDTGVPASGSADGRGAFYSSSVGSRRSLRSPGPSGSQSSRLRDSYIPTAATATSIRGRGAPHLPHVRSTVEIVLPTPLAPQTPVLPLMHSGSISRPSSAFGGYGYSDGEEARNPSRDRDRDRDRDRGRSTLRRSASRNSMSSVRTDAWTDATLAARHLPQSQSQADSQPRSASTSRRAAEELVQAGGSMSRPGSRNGNGNGRNPPPPPQPPLPPLPNRTTPWADEPGSRPLSGSSISASGSSSSIAARKYPFHLCVGRASPDRPFAFLFLAPSSWRNSGRASSSGGLDQY